MRLRDIKEALHELIPEVLQIQIYTKLLDASRPQVPSASEVMAAVPSAKAGTELLRSFARLGAAQAQTVFDFYLKRVASATDAGDLSVAQRQASALAERVAEAIAGGVTSGLETFVAALRLLEDAGCVVDPPVAELVDEGRSARSGDLPQLAVLEKLASEVVSLSRAQLSDKAWVSFVCHLLAPTFDGNYLNPEVPNQFIPNPSLGPRHTWTASLVL